MAEYHRDRTTPQYHYNQQKQNARARGVAWEFSSWQEWYAVWTAEQWANRGKKKGQFVMRRHGDVGPYSPANVFIGEAGENAHDGLKDYWEKRKKEKAAAAVAPSAPTDVTFAGRADLANAKRFWKEEIATTTQSTPQTEKPKKKIFFKKQKELTFFQKLLLPLTNLFKQQRV